MATAPPITDATAGSKVNEHKPIAALPCKTRGDYRRSEGFTLMEILVSIGIIGMLMALSLPAVQQAREAGRAAQCANNLRNIGLAMAQHADAKRRFPATGNFSTTGVRFHSWVVPLLPLLERSDIHARWDYNKPIDVAPNNALARTGIAVLTCPDDDTVVRGEGNLSFAVNSGFGFTIPMDCPATYRSAHSPTPGVQPIDLNGNGVVTITQSAPDGAPSDRTLLYFGSLFFLENWPPGKGSQRHHSTDSVRDGLSQTLMIAENVRAGYDPYTGANWAWPDPQRVGFLLSGYICRNASCSPGNVDYQHANRHDGGPWLYESLNAARNQAEGQAPWPSSYHPAGVQMVFADGHLHTMSQDVDGAVYAALVTPEGTLLEPPLNQRLVADSDY